jgi:hypothetical protein
LMTRALRRSASNTVTESYGLHPVRIGCRAWNSTGSTQQQDNTMARTYKTCRYCLGNGCVHCKNTGQVPSRTFSRRDIEAARLRRLLFGDATLNTTAAYGQAAR